ncbi:MAG TPA: glycosyl hydrolase, partial [Thermomicrobiaceae bacterium]|nr:glycosyl hydrolase [Thermomicrobiaceae bacterium]
TRNPGLPDDLIGKIGVSVSPANPERVWALVESKKGGLFRSDDGGETWKLTSADMDLRQRPWYYMHVFADPKDENVVYVDNLSVYKSTDGGKSFTTIPVPHGDTHDLWIDPNDTKRMINGNDGGACITFDGGISWSSIYNQPTAQFYHVVTDNQVPYRLYGAQQDNSTLSVPSRTETGAITFADCFPVGGGESGYIAVRPDNPNIIYAGSYGGLLTRLDHSTGQVRNISAWPDNPMGYPAGALKYRFQWTYPIVLSPHDPNTLYVTSNHVHRTRDDGQSFEVISPDLTRNDPDKLGDSGGDISHDNTSVEYYGTIFAFAESPVQAGVLWTGSDDGLIHVSRDNGESWQNVTPKEMPEWCLISIIEASPHDAGTAYVAATRYKLDDFAPYIYKTNDFGETWTKITDGIRDNDFARAIREDPWRRGLLFAGTESGFYVSLDDGAHWQPFRQNLPVTPVHDIAVKDNDLVVATHGRAFWSLDDITPLRQYDGSKLGSAHLFEPPTTIRFRAGGWRLSSGGVGQRGFTTGSSGSVLTYQKSESETSYLDAGKNPPAGITVSYYLKAKPEGEITLTVSDSAGNEIQKFSSEKPEKEQAGNEHTPAPKKPLIPKDAGLNRFSWNLRYPDAEFLPGAVMWAGSINGPAAPPGTYHFTLTVDGETYTTDAELVADPRSGVSDQDLREQFNFLLRIRDKLSETHKAIKQLRDIRSQIELWEKRLGDKQAAGVTELANEMKKELTEIEEELIQVKSVAREDPLNFPIKLNNKLAAVGSVVAAGDNKPTNQSREVFEQLAGRVDEQLEKLREIAEQDVKEFNAQVREADLPAISEQ